MTNYIGLQQRVYSISDAAFAAGGEATLYYVDNHPGLVAKIYKPGKNTREREDKLKTMVVKPPVSTNEIAWPRDILYNQSGVFSGFIMPLIKGRKKLREIYVFDNRTEVWSYYVRVALNIAIAVYNVHEINQVIGDLNPENILVDKRQGLVTLVDTDSFHIYNYEKGALYRCSVGMAEMLPREMQGKTLATLAPANSFNQYTDNFSLALLIFMTLMNGAHPFACSITDSQLFSGSSVQPVDNIKNGLCLYFPKDTKIPNGVAIPAYAPDIHSLPVYIRLLFKHAFIDGHSNPSVRPSAKDWYNALSRLEEELTTCSVNPSHQYYKGAMRCPWCGVNAKLKGVREKTTKRQSSSTGQRSTSVSKMSIAGSGSSTTTGYSVRHPTTPQSITPVYTQSSSTAPPQFQTIQECQNIIVDTLNNLPKVQDAMRKTKVNGDTGWIDRFLQSQKNIEHLKKEFKKQNKAVFSDDDVKKYVRWYYQTKI